MRRPGGELARRPLKFVWLVDGSGSMNNGGKIQALNAAVREALPAMKDTAAANPHANVEMGCVRFSHGAAWVGPKWTPLGEFGWQDIEADATAGGRVDVVFLIDTSGSMGDEIDAVKSHCKAFASRVAESSAIVRLGLIGFDIGFRPLESVLKITERSRRTHAGKPYTVATLSKYTVGVWPLVEPSVFQGYVESLTVGMFGGMGCYLANLDTIDIFPEVVSAFDRGEESDSVQRKLVIISDEIGNHEGVGQILKILGEHRITAHIMGIKGREGHPSPHEAIARGTEGRFWDIRTVGQRRHFSVLLDELSGTIKEEVVRSLGTGKLSYGTDMGDAIELVARELSIETMGSRALPPVLILVTDGKPSDDAEAAIRLLNRTAWGQKCVRLGIAIGRDADRGILLSFARGNAENVLEAKNAPDLARWMRFASTAALSTASRAGAQTW